MRHVSRTLAAALFLSTLAASESDAQAAERWIDRPMTLHRMVFAGDAGLGIGHLSVPGPDYTGVGMNLEGSFGITERLEVGLRTGVRMGRDGELTQADRYGRTLWTETYGGGADTFANPEARIRWVAYSGSIAEVGLDGRMYLPFEDGTRIGMMFGVPLAFHVSDLLRIDTGAYTPVLFYNPAFWGISIPGYFWFQVNEKLWLGPMTQIQVLGQRNRDPHLGIGFGLGYQVASSVDLKTMLLFPAVDDDTPRQIGAGFGVQFRIGE